MIEFNTLIKVLSTMLECGIEAYPTEGRASLTLSLTFEFDQQFIRSLPYASPLLCAEQVVDQINQKIGTPSIRKVEAKLYAEECKRRSEKRKHEEEIEEWKGHSAGLEKYKTFYEMWFKAKENISRVEFDTMCAKSILDGVDATDLYNVIKRYNEKET